MAFAKLLRADLHDAKLSRAECSGTDFTDAILTDALDDGPWVCEMTPKLEDVPDE